MPKPLRSESVIQPKDLQFKHFGVMNSGEQSKASLFTSVTVNIVLVVLAIIVGAAAKKTIDNRAKENLTFVTPVKPLPPEPPKPKVKLPPVPPPPPPKIKPIIEPPKILPAVKVVDPPKPVPMKPMEAPKPALTQAPPKPVIAPAAPKAVAFNLPKAAAIPNNDPHPTPARMGNMSNPITASDRPAVANAPNLGNKGIPGMPGSNSGNGPHATAMNMGSGSPSSGSLSGNGARPVAGKFGVTNGVPGATGNSNAPRAASFAPPPPAAAAPSTVAATRLPVHTTPTLISKPEPVYSAEAKAMHLEGTVSVRIHVSSTGAVTVIGVTSGLGHGLDEAAINAARGTRFRPAQDTAGNPTDWEGVVKVSFQLS